MEKARVKFHVVSINQDFGFSTVLLKPIMDNDPENMVFSTLRPQGELRMRIDDNAPAKEFLKPGQDYFVEFTKA